MYKFVSSRKTLYGILWVEIVIINYNLVNKNFDFFSL